MPVQQQSMAGQKVAAYLSLAQKSETLWSGVLIFLGALMLLSTIPFYPIYLVFILAAACGALAWKTPPGGLILGAVLAFPAIVYQSAVFGWFYVLILAAILFESVENWKIVAVLEVLILAPFAFGGLPFAGYISILGMGIGALYFGSKKSVAVSLPSVFMILLLSSIWLMSNSAYLPLKMELYKPGQAELQMAKEAVGLGGMVSGIATGLGNFLSIENVGLIWGSLGWIAGNIFLLLLNDSLFLQLVSWGIALYLLGFLPSRIKQRPQLLSSLSLLILLPFNLLIGTLYGTGFGIEFAGGVVLSIAVLGILEQMGVSISRESQLQRKDRMKAYGKFGMTDMSMTGEERSMADVGGYDDVKQELRDAIIMPLEKKEIAYTYGIKPPAGILLFGPPGTGKTMLMRALAKELKYNFIEVKCSQILSQWYGESLPGDEQLVIQEEGEIRFRKIAEIVENKQKVKVLGFDLYGKAVFADIKDWIKHKCTSPVFEVKTRTGRRIRVTGYHSLFTLNGTKIESVPTSKLIPKKSYIAIPHRMNFSDKAANRIEFLLSLKDDDKGLYVKNPSEYLKRAISKIGKGKTARLLGYTTQEYLDQVICRDVGVRVSSFLNLMEKADIDFDREEVLIGAGSKRLPGVIRIDEQFATFLGIWVAEGSYNRRDTVRICVSSEEAEKVSKLCKDLFGHVTVYRKGEGGGRDICIGSRPLFVLMNHTLDLQHGAGDKKAPEIVFNFKKENIAAFLRGYFSGDGSIYENQNGVATIEALTASSRLANDILHLLLYFGIVARIYNKKEWNGTITNRICLIGGKHLSAFKEIGFLDSRRMRRLGKSLSDIGWFRSEQIPIEGSLHSLIQKHMPKWSASRTIGRDKLLQYCSEDEVNDLCENDIYLDRVETITRVDGEEFVYDVSVDPCQNFVAGFGGIFAHNSEKNVKEVFDNARKQAPTVLFFDEIDSIAKKRSSESLDEVGPRVLSEILQQIDGAAKAKGTVMVIGATNLPSELDRAILRPGRLDKIIYMHLPDPEARKRILEVHLRGLPVADDVDLDALVKRTERFSGADIKNIVVEAKRLAAKEASALGAVVPLKMEHFQRILKNVKPSTTLAQIDQYESFRMDFERRVGAEKAGEELTAKEAAVGWEDVAGLDDVKQALLEAIELPLLHEEEMKKFHVKPSKGILLFGPPGTGKTLIVKAASHELKASFQTLSGAEIMKKGYTGAVNVIKETFNRARENTPAIIFVDEIETFAPGRGRGGASEIIGQFLTEMDGVKGLKGVVVIGATNKPSFMDAAIMRPGRFDKIFYIPPPETAGRAAIFGIHLGEFAQGVALQQLAEMTPGFTGADIAAICQSAKMEALRSKLAGKPKSITTEMLLAIIRTRRPSVTKSILQEYEQFMEAYGERR